MKTNANRAVRFIKVIMLTLITSIVPYTILAQEKYATNTVKYPISKLTTDIDLQHIKEEINNENIAQLSFSKIQRNKSGELIGIKTQFKDNNGYSQVNSQYRSDGISPFFLVINSNEKEKTYLSIENDVISTAYRQSHDLSDEYIEDEATSVEDMMKMIKEDMQKQQEMIEQLMKQSEQETTSKTSKKY